jgi:diguanylate cyclase (GGDEF)-like protein/PAS domain S-box-containing protein
MRAPDPRKAPAAHDAVDAIDALQRVALLDVNARDSQVGVVLSICLIAFAGLVLRDAAPAASFAWWMAAVTAAAVLRALISWAWRREHASQIVSGTDTTSDRAALLRWERAYVMSALCSGLAWSSLTLVSVDLEQVALPVTLILTMALILASTSPVGSRLAQLLFMGPVVVAQEFNLIRLVLVERGNHDALLAIVWLAVVFVLVLVKRNSSSMLRETLAARIDHERRASEQTALLENAPLGILVVRGTRIVVCNDASLKLLGYARREDLLGKSVRVLFPDDAAWRDNLQHARAATEGPVAPRVVRRQRADGAVIEVMFTIAAVKTPGGDTEFIGIYENAQEKLAAEENYRHALRMQRLVFESAGEGIAIVNNGVIEQANQALADLIGVSTTQLTDRPLRTIFENPEGWQEIERRFQRLGNTLKLEQRILRSDGRSVWVNVTGRFIDAPTEALAHVVAGNRSIWILADLSMQKQKEAENWHHANHDVMTGLPNRRFLLDRLDQAIASARRDGRRVAAVELDLDGFKSVNDSYGHHFGDAVLEEVARRLSTVVRELDTVGRWGGDEFVLVLREIESREVVEETVKRVIARLSESIAYMGQDLSVGASIGIAVYPDHGDEVETLMLAADLAMYESKGAGGNTWRFASPVAVGPRGKYRPATAAPITAAE